MFAVTAVLPLQFDLCTAVAGKVQVAKDVAAVLTFNWILSGGEESFLVLRTKYSHFAYSLRRCFSLQAIRCSTHKPWLSSGEFRGDGGFRITNSLTDALVPRSKNFKLGERVRRWGLAGVFLETLLNLGNRLEQEIGDYKQNLVCIREAVPPFYGFARVEYCKYIASS